MSVIVSISTAIYNVDEDLLRAHIEGILKQLTDETELLLIDDGSTNNCGQICCDYAQRSRSIRYINMEKNQGLSSVRNRTIDEAQGEWVFFADGDDLLSDNFVETALSLVKDDYDIIVHERHLFTNEKSIESPCTVRKLTALQEDVGRELSISILCVKPLDMVQCGLNNNVFYTAAWGALYRRDFLVSSDCFRLYWNINVYIM